jgi:hypothetical protein
MSWEGCLPDLSAWPHLDHYNDEISDFPCQLLEQFSLTQIIPIVSSIGVPVPVQSEKSKQVRNQVPHPRFARRKQMAAYKRYKQDRYVARRLLLEQPSEMNCLFAEMHSARRVCKPIGNENYSNLGFLFKISRCCCSLQLFFSPPLRTNTRLLLNLSRRRLLP